MYKLAIVDDDQRVANGLRDALLSAREVTSIICRDSGLHYAVELEKTSKEALPDVIIMDISMSLPDEGIQATRKIKSEHPDIQIIMFTISDEDERIFEAFKAGAMGYLVKSEDPSFILKTVIDVMNGGAQMSPSIARKAIQYLSPPPKPSTQEPKSTVDQPLTAREREVLDFVAKGRTYPDIAEQLNIATHTVKKHMMNIFQKLHVKNKIEALKKVDRLG